MLVAWGLVASLLITPDAGLPGMTSAPIMVNVTAPSDLSRGLVSALLEEAAALWRPSGVRFMWQRTDRPVRPQLRVVIGGGAGRPTDEALPLGWIVFDADNTPEPQIFVSHTNALLLLTNSRQVVGHVDAMPIAERETYLARAMGRALAHELGHFLLASKRHAETGLMRARHTSPELFGASRKAFTIDGGLRDQLAAGNVSQRQIASR